MHLKTLWRRSNSEELGDEAEIEPLLAEDTLAASRVVIDSEPGLGLDEALAKEELEQRKSAQESFSTQREIQTTGFVSSEIEPVQKPIFFDDDGQEIPFIQPDNVEAPALWREPSSKQFFPQG